MSIPYTVSTYLHNNRVDYDVITHWPTTTSQRTAQAAHVSGHQVAKAVVLMDGNQFIMAVIPASRQLKTKTLAEFLHTDLSMATEDDFSMVFRDCQLGAIPPLGKAYGMKTIVDDALRNQSDLYLESGDHEHLLHVNREGFLKLMHGCSHAKLS